MVLNRFSVLFSALLLPAILPAQEPPAARSPERPTVRVAPVSGSIQVDGLLDEPAWEAAEAVSAFTQVDPEEGRPVSEATEARILFDDEAIYIGGGVGTQTEQNRSFSSAITTGVGDTTTLV